MFLQLFLNKKNQIIIGNISDKNNIFSLHPFKYLLIPVNRYMHHSIIDVVLDLKNMQTIKRKAQGHYTIMQK